jgi:hypothetical protein
MSTIHFVLGSYLEEDKTLKYYLFWLNIPLFGILSETYCIFRGSCKTEIAIIF